MLTKFKVHITTAAQSDLESIWVYLESESRELAVRFVSSLEDHLTTLERMPLRCPGIPENDLLNSNYRHLLVDPYRIIFRVGPRSVWILRIVHGARLLDASFFE